MASWRESLGLEGGSSSGELDPNAHTGSWTQIIGVGTVVVVVVGLGLRSMCCAATGRSVNDTDAPELEEFATHSGATAKRVDSVRIKAGRYVSAAPCNPVDEEEVAWGSGRPSAARKAKKPRPKPKPKRDARV